LIQSGLNIKQVTEL